MKKYQSKWVHVSLMSEGKTEFITPLSLPPRSSHSPAHEDGAPCLEDAEAAVLPEPHARCDRGEPRPAHRPAVRERRAVDPH